jgi:hypothetical protein
MVPYVESVSIWDIYPDMSATDPDDLRYVFQRHVMSRSDLMALADREDFNADVIREFVVAHKDGTAVYKNFEQELRTLDTDREGDDRQGLLTSRDKRYEVLEYWGTLDADDIRKSGADVPEILEGMELFVNVWLLQDKVIKFEVSPIQSIGIPYYWYYFAKDETSIWGEGIPVIMRDPQRLFNASVRALLDNTAASAGPIYEINEDMLMPGQNPDNLLPFTNVYRVAEASRRSIQPSGCIRCRLMRSSTSSSSTSSALSQTRQRPFRSTFTVLVRASRELAVQWVASPCLWVAPITVVKDQVRTLDDRVVKPFIRAMYYWNMELGDVPSVKGDFEVDAQGSASLIAREVRAEKLITYLQHTANPIDAPLTDRAYLQREIARCLDLGDRAVKTDDVIAMEQQRNAQVQQQMATMQQAIDELQNYIKQLEQAVKAQHIGRLDDPASAATRESLVNAASF